MSTGTENPFSDEIDRRIARLVMRGESNKAIAAAIGLPEGTVKWRLHRLYDRFGVASRAQFVLKVRDLGLA